MITSEIRQAVDEICTFRPYAVRLEGVIFTTGGTGYRLWWSAEGGFHGQIIHTHSWQDYCEAVRYSIGRLKAVRESWEPSKADAVAVFRPATQSGAFERPIPSSRPRPKRPARRETWVETRESYLKAKGM